MGFTNVAFKLNKVETFIYTFSDGQFKIDEYIHGIVIEFMETDRDGNPTVVKINQINNLKAYTDKTDKTLTERIFRVSELRPFINYRT